jgi:predicted RNase H-like HicB family nuclease
MLVTFTCKAYADITMFGDAALSLLKMMGHSETVPGAILAEDVPAALDRLKSAIETGKAVPAQSESKENPSDESNEQPVTVAHRALPLIELLTAAAKENCDVMWK